MTRRRPRDISQRERREPKMQRGVLREERARAERAHERRGERRRDDRAETIDEQQSRRDQAPCLSSRHGRSRAKSPACRACRSSGRRQSPRAISAKSMRPGEGQRQFDQRADAHHADDHEAAVDTVGQQPDRQHADRRAEHDRRREKRHGVGNDADAQGVDAPQRRRRAVGGAGDEGRRGDRSAKAASAKTRASGRCEGGGGASALVSASGAIAEAHQGRADGEGREAFRDRDTLSINWPPVEATKLTI